MEYTIHHFKNVKPGTLVVIWSAVSKRSQQRDRTLNRQIKRIRRAVEKAGCVVLEVFTYVGPRYGIPKRFISCSK